jgi:hypothetical protein
VEPHDKDGDKDYGGYRGYGGVGEGYGGGFAEGFPDKGPEGLQLCPWERREQFGFLNALYLTTREVLMAPQRFFRRMPSRVGLTQPLLYALILGVAAAFLGWLWSLAGNSLQVLMAEDLGKAFRGPLWSFFIFVGSPLLVVIAVFVRAALMHLMLMLLGGNRLGFEATFRVAAYGQAAGVLALLPFCGWLIALLWELAIEVIGLYSIHGTDPWRAMVAVLMPLLFCASTIGAALMLAVLGLR